MSPDTLEQRIAKAMVADCTHSQVPPCNNCQRDAKWARKKAPDIARALEAGLVDLCGKSDGVEFDLTSASDAFIAALSEDK